MPEELQTQLRAAMEAAGIPVPKSEERWAKAMTALKVHVTLSAWHLSSGAPHVKCRSVLQRSSNPAGGTLARQSSNNVTSRASPHAR